MKSFSPQLSSVFTLTSSFIYCWESTFLVCFFLPVPQSISTSVSQELGLASVFCSFSFLNVSVAKISFLSHLSAFSFHLGKARGETRRQEWPLWPLWHCQELKTSKNQTEDWRLLPCEQCMKQLSAMLYSHGSEDSECTFIFQANPNISSKCCFHSLFSFNTCGLSKRFEG